MVVQVWEVTLDFCYGGVNIEMPVIYIKGDVELLVGYVSSEGK